MKTKMMLLLLLTNLYINADSLANDYPPPPPLPDCTPRPGAFSLVAPANASPQPIGNITLSWDSSTNANDYDVYFGYLFIGSTSQTFWVVPGSTLQPNTTYYWGVYAWHYGSGCLSTYWPSSPLMFSFTTGSVSTVPAAPSNLTVTDVSGQPQQIDLSWTDNSNNETGFKIQRKLNSESDQSWADVITVAANITTYSNTGLDSSAIYNYRVCACNGGVNSSWSNTPTESPCPSKPAGLSAVPGNSTVTLDWTDNPQTDGITYKVYRRQTGGSYGGAIVTGLTSSAYTDYTVSNDTAYYYAVKAVDNRINESILSDEVAANPQDLPPAAPTLAVTAGNGCAVLSWGYTPPESAPGDVHYCVYRSTVNGGPYILIEDNVSGATFTDNVPSSNVSSRTYYYVVTAVDNGSNESDKSNQDDALLNYPIRNLNRDIRYATIQLAIDAAFDNETIQVPAGTYTENLSFSDKKITLTSDDPQHPGNTVIQASAGNIITFGAGDGASTITGFTIRRSGTSSSTTGISCAGASPTIRNCVISENDARGVHIPSGSITLIETTITDNATTDSGGAIYANASATIVLKDCTITGNTAASAGGAIYGGSAQSQILRTKITGNSSTSGAGAISDSGAAISNSYISDNHGYTSQSSCAATALYNCDGDIINCTIVNNHGPIAACAAVAGCDGTIENTIVWGDTTSTGVQISNCAKTPLHCCIQEWTGTDTNIHPADPMLSGYHLQDNSPCINKGNSANITDKNETDLDGRHRLCSTAIDIGAYEYGKVVYVDIDVATSGNGQSWGTAYKYLQDALTDTGTTGRKFGDEIWVAGGIPNRTYYPDESISHSGWDNDRTKSFTLVSGVAVYGGFKGPDSLTGYPGETSLNERNVFVNKCILSGDIKQDDVEAIPQGDNSYHMVTTANGSLIDGFTIKGGIADVTGNTNGAGILCQNGTVMIRNCYITCNKAAGDGAGIYIPSGVTVAELTNCILDGNWAFGNGAGIFCASNSGGSSDTSHIALINCTIHANKALDSGGGVYTELETADGDALTGTNCIFWANIDKDDSQESSQIYKKDGTDILTPTITYSCIQCKTNYTGIGNISSNPTFIQNGEWTWYKTDGTKVQNGTILTMNPNSDVLFFYDFKENVADIGKANTSDYKSEKLVGPELHLTENSYFTSKNIPLASYYKTPVSDKDQGSNTVSNDDHFYLWFTNMGVDGTDKGPKVTKQVDWTCTNAGKGVFTFNSEHFFPLDGLGLSGQPEYSCGNYYATLNPRICDGDHNYYFTMVYHGKITYDPKQTFHFKASDDLFVAINNKIIMDRGGYYNYQSNGYAYPYNRGPSRTTVQLKDGNAYVYEFPEDSSDLFNVHHVDPHDVSTLEPYVGSNQNQIAKQEIVLNLEPYQTYDFDLFFAQRQRYESVLVVERTPGDDETVYKYIPGNYHLQAGSPCVDAGDNDKVPAGVVTDLDSKARRMDDQAIEPDLGHGTKPVVDMGAYEYTPIQVNAGEDKTTTMPKDTVALLDAAVDGGYDGLVTTTWTLVHAPLNCSVDFNPDTIDTSETSEKTSNLLNPSVKFFVDDAIFATTGYANFELKLTATDGTSSVSDTVVVKVYPGAYQNQAPQVTAGTYTGVTAGTELLLNQAMVTDDGLPFGMLDVAWEIVSLSTDVSGQWEFIPGYGGNITNARITFFQPGPYRLRLSASDGQLSGESYTEIIVGGTVNNPPVVEAGFPDYTANSVPLPYTLDLSTLSTRPYAVDSDGSNPLAITWSVVSGDLTAVVFDTPRPTSLPQPPASVPIRVTFKHVGVYILRLTADDGRYKVSDEVVIEIQAPLVPTKKIYAGTSKSSSVGAKVFSRTFPTGTWVAISEPADFGSPDAVLCLCEDGTGTIYAGTDGAGDTEGNVYKYIGNNWTIITDWRNVGGVPYNVTKVYSLAIYDGKLFAGTDFPNVLFKYENNQWAAIEVTGQASGIRSLYVWDGRLYLDANKKDGVDYYDSLGYHPTRGIGGIWGVNPSATGNELIKFDPWTGTIFNNYSLAIAGINANNTKIGLSGWSDALYYINGDINNGLVTVISPINGSIINTFQISGGWGVDGLGYWSGQEGAFLFTSGCTAYDDVHRYGASDGADPQFNWGPIDNPSSIAGDNGGRIFTYAFSSSQGWGIYELDPLDSANVAFVCASPSTSVVGMAFDGEYLYLSDLNNTVYILDVTSGNILNSLNLGYVLYGLASTEGIYNKIIWDMQDYSDMLLSGANSGTLYGLQIIESGNTITDSTSGTANTGLTNNIRELEVFDGSLYMSVGAVLYKPTVSMSGENVSVDLGTPVTTAGDEIISMLATDSMLLIGTGTEATNSNFTTSTLGVLSYNGSTFTTESTGLAGSGVQCLLEADGKDTPEHIALGVTVQIEQNGSFVNPGSEMTLTPLDSKYDEALYNISYTSTGQSNATSMVLTAHLPDGTKFVSANNGGAYDDSSRSVIWYLSDATSGPYTVRWAVDEKTSLPGADLKMQCWVENYKYVRSVLNQDMPVVRVRCWSGNIVYVDAGNDSGNYNGVSWETAFNSLAQALSYVNSSSCTCNQIWVANGTYPTYAGFTLPAGVWVIGGFAGYEKNIADRDHLDSANSTILSGIGENDYVVTGADTAILDGFTITGGHSAGIYCDNTSPTITRCKIKGNGGDGIHCTGTAAPTIKNSWISDNAGDGIEASTTTSTVLNNTITNNDEYSVNCTGGTSLPLKNCILSSPPNNCDISLPNKNIIGDPGFDPDDGYHLLSTATSCINQGDSTGISDSETDIDGQPRKVGTVDIGADEHPPVVVKAGDDKEASLNVDTGIAEVTFDDTELTVLDPASLSNLNLEWVLIDGSQTGINWNGQQNALKPTFKFSEVGWYDLELQAKNGTQQIAKGKVSVWVGVGMTIASQPSETIAGGTTALSIAKYADGTQTGNKIHHIKWSGPAGVTFGTTASAPHFETIATFNGKPARYQIVAVAYDSATESAAHYLGEQDIWVPVNHQQVTVDIFADRTTMTQPDNTANLSASVSGVAGVKFTWIAPEGAENIVHFGNSSNSGINSQNTSVIFNEGEYGTFEIGCQAEDEYGYPIGAGQITITVNPPDFSSLIVDTCPKQTINCSQNFAFLSGTIKGGQLGTHYHKVKWIAPAGISAVFEDSSKLNTKVTFTPEDYGSGDYEFGLLAIYVAPDLTEHTVGVGKAVVTVTGCTGGSYSSHLTFTMSITPPAPLTLSTAGSRTASLTCTIDGSEKGSVKSVEWICFSQQNSVAFDNPVQVFNPANSTVSSDVTFTAPSEYHIGLVAKDADGHELGTAVTTVKVNSYYEDASVTVSADKTNVTLFADDTVKLTATASNVEFNWLSWSEASGTVEFSDTAQAESGGSFTATATAKFHAAGTYTINFTTKQGGQYGAQTGYGCVKVTVNPPSVVVKAKAGSAYNAVTEGPYSVVYKNATRRVYLNGEHTDISGNKTYQWECIEWPGAIVRPTPNPDTDDTDKKFYVDLNVADSYTFKLSVLVNGQFVGSDEVEVILLSGRPVAGVGVYYSTAKVGQPFHLDKAYVLDDESIIENNIVWYSDPPLAADKWNYSSPYSKDKPGVIFPNERTYDIWVHYVDGDGFDVTSKKVTISAIDAAYVSAGDDRTIVPFVPVKLDSANVDPLRSGLSYKWTVGAEINSSLVKFEPSDSVLNPTITYIGEYSPNLSFTLTLKVNNQQPPYINTDKATITVRQNPIQDTDGAPDITPFTVSSTCGQAVVINAVATDQNIDRLYVKIGDIELTPANCTAYNLTSSANTLTLSCTVDTYSFGTGNFVAYATDKIGKQTATSPISKSCSITDYSVTPAVATSSSSTLTFTAAVQHSWQLRLFPIGGTTPLTGMDYSGAAGTVNVQINFATAGTLNGRYEAHLTDTSTNEVAIIYFDVAMGSITNDLVAQIDKSLQIVYDSQQVPQNAMQTIRNDSTGKYTLLGKAYYNNTVPVNYQVLMTNESGTSTYVTFDSLNSQGFKKAAVGSSSSDGTLAEIDLSKFESGIYTIKLVVEYGGFDKSSEVQVVVDNLIKLGNVKFSQEDLSVTVGGVPLQMVRTYDSFKRKEKGDFGYGWAYSLANMDIKLNETRSTDRIRRTGPTYDRDVTLTLPTGQRVTFASKYPRYGSKYCLEYGVPEAKGVKSFTTSQSEYIDIVQRYPYNLQIWGGDNWCGTLEYLEFENDCLGMHDVAGYKLTMDDGTVYNIARHPYGRQTVTVPYYSDYIDDETIDIYWYTSYGKPYLESIDLTNGDKIEFDYSQTPSGQWDNPICTKVSYLVKNASTGDYEEPIDAIEIVRDPDGLIQAIYAPEQANAMPKIATIKYDYDYIGNLSKVHKLVDAATSTYETTTYGYSNGTWQPEHSFVTDIKDPRGLSPIQYVYDETGMLVATIDAKGNRIELSHGLSDSTGKYEEVYDERTETKTRYYYNSRGNVVLMQKWDKNETSLLDQTQSMFAANLGDSVTVNITRDSATYTETFPVSYLDSPYEVIDNAGNATYYKYDENGRLLRVIDPEINVTDNFYDDLGNLRITTQYKRVKDGTTFRLDEVSTTENIYDPGTHQLIFTGMRKGSSPVVWHSMTLNYYNTYGRLTHTVQVDMDKIAHGLTDIFTDSYHTALKEITSLSGYADNAHAITQYAYTGTATQPDSVTDPAGATTYSHYNANGVQDASWYDVTVDGTAKRVFSITEFDAQDRAIKTYRYVDASETLVSADYAIEHRTTYGVLLSKTVYSNGKVDTTTDEFGVVTKNWYDETSNVVQVDTYLESAPSTILTTSKTLYDKEGKVLVTVGPYDPAVYSQAQSNWPTAAENVYDSLGRVEKVRKWQNAKILDFEDKTTYKKVYDGVTVRNAWGTNTGETGAAPSGSNYGWVVSNGTSAVTPVVGNETSCTRTDYDTVGRVWKTYQQDENGDENWINEYTYDAAGKQIKVKVLPGTADEAVTETHYDGTRRDWVKDARNNTTHFDYDALGRITKNTHPESDYLNASLTTVHGELYSHVEYDGLGRRSFESERTAQSDPLAAVGKEFEYDTAGRLKTVTLPQAYDAEQSANASAVYRYIYDVQGNTAANFDSKNRITIFKYNELNQQTYRYVPFVPANPDDIQTSQDVYGLSLTGKLFEKRDYDGFGRLIQVTDYANQIAIYTYDSLGRLWHVYYYQSFSNYNAAHPTYNASPEIEYVYDNLGRKVSAVIRTYNSSGTILESATWDYAYDPEGRVKSISSSQYGVIAYDYNPITGRRTVTKSPIDGSAVQTDYYYDVLGRVDEVVQGTAHAAYTYNDVGSLETITYTSGGYSITGTYAYDNLNQLDTLTWSGNSSTLSFDYDVYATGNRAKVTQSNGPVIKWWYDNVGRLTKEQTGTTTPTEYFYDRASNRHHVTGSSPTNYYEYNEKDQLLAESPNADYTNPTVTYSYDDNGSLTSKSISGQSAITYQYNLLNQLKSVNNGAPYKYNPDGIRVAAGNTTYLVDPYNPTGYAQVLKETTGAQSKKYVIGLDVVAQSDSSGVNFIIYDGHGSVRQVTGSSGNLAVAYNYDAYGNAVGFTPTNGLYYAGEMYDTSLGMYNLRARYYNPANGRFNAMDTYSGNNTDPISLHKYLYCNSNPVNRLDPSGNDSLASLSMAMTIGSLILYSANVANAPGPEDIAIPDTSGEMIIDAAFYLAGGIATEYIIAPIARTTLKYVGNRLRYFKSPGGLPEPGAWLKVKEHMSPRAAEYQMRITGRQIEDSYMVNGVKFDGFNNRILLDAKGPGYKNFVKNGEFRDWFRGQVVLRNQAKRQLEAAAGTSIEWHVAEKEAVPAFEKLLKEEGFTQIKVIYMPAGTQ